MGLKDSHGVLSGSSSCITLKGGQIWESRFPAFISTEGMELETTSIEEVLKNLVIIIGKPFKPRNAFVLFIQGYQFRAKLVEKFQVCTRHSGIQTGGILWFAI